MVIVLGDMNWLYWMVVVLDDGCTGWCVYFVVIVLDVIVLSGVDWYCLMVVLVCDCTAW